MEDYQSAFIERHIDTHTLSQSGRKVAAMHFGGVTIECLLKAMIFASLPTGATHEWMTDSYDPGHTFTNPGHSYIEALKRLNRVSSQIDKFREVRKWLDEVENPNGQHFIHMRSSGIEPADPNYKRWLYAYQSLKGWLHTQATQL